MGVLVVCLRYLGKSYGVIVSEILGERALSTYLAVNRPLMASMSRVSDSSVLGKLLSHKQTRIAATHINLHSSRTIPMLNLCHLSLSTAFACASLEAGSSPHQKRDGILQEKSKLALWPGLMGSLPRLSQASGSPSSSGKSL